MTPTTPSTATATAAHTRARWVREVGSSSASSDRIVGYRSEAFLDNPRSSAREIDAGTEALLIERRSPMLTARAISAADVPANGRSPWSASNSATLNAN